ncbi:denticleless protein homolog [Caerostris darwini]|uniref:Denticleless protein homolog n=1 Tax=Caerostris darwini TaxID=1538125 RepID=A0AAV4SSQ4_9ARAC|nr:denticleless protein homolog [Caerostris darwini]
MFLLPYLNDRQTGINRKGLLHATNCQLNVDSLLSKLVCWAKDAHFSVGENGIYTPPLSCKFRRDYALDLLAVAREDGNIELFNTEFGNGGMICFNAHNNAIFDICWMPDNFSLITASGDFSCRLFDVETCKMVSAYQGHLATVKSVDICSHQSAIFASGSRDGNICIWDKRVNYGLNRQKPSILIHSAHSHKHIKSNSKKHSSSNCVNSVSAVAFQDEYKLASVGVADGLVKSWDLRKTYVCNPNRLPMPRHQMKCGESNSKTHGYTSLTFDSRYQKLYACSTSNEICQFDFHSHNDKVITYSGFKCNSYYVKLALSWDDQYLLCGSSDCKAYIWKTAKPGSPILELLGHSAEVTTVAWSPHNLTKLATCGDDNRTLIWNLKDEEEKVDINVNEVVGSTKFYSKDNDSFKSTTSNELSESFMTSKSTSVSSPTTVIRKSSKSLPHSIKNEAKVRTQSITSFFSPVSQTLSQSLTDEDSASKTSLCSHSTKSSPQRSVHKDNIHSTMARHIKFAPPSLPCLTHHDSENNTSPVFHSDIDFNSCAQSQLQNIGEKVNTDDYSPEICSNEPHSPEIHEMLLSPSKSSPHGKENNSVAKLSSDKSKPNGQLKRKASELTGANICKDHPHGCGKTKGCSRCGKVVVTSPSTPSIKTYFRAASVE